MSLDSLTFFDRGPACLDQESLIAQLRTDAPALLSVVVERYRRTWRPQDWDIDTKGAIVGPGGFIIEYGSKLIKVFHMLSFARTFRYNPESRDQLRLAYLSLGGLFDATELIYTHELAPCSGATLEDIAECLRKSLGKPATSLDQLGEAGDDWGEASWFRENLFDLRRELLPLSKDATTDIHFTECGLCGPELKRGKNKDMMNAHEIKRKVDEELGREERFTHWHGITRENIVSFLVEPYKVTVDPNDIESATRPMWVVLHENPKAPEKGYVVVFDPRDSTWGIAKHGGGANFLLVESTATLALALDSM
jgi:hypothetical protein